MSFRDDHDAALARAEALEEELARTKAENERLERENAELKKPKKQPKPPKAKPPRPRPPSSSDDAPARKPSNAPIGKYVGTAIVVVVIGTIVVAPGVIDCRKQRAYERERAAWETHKARWGALLRFDDCLRSTTEAVRYLARFDATDPRGAAGTFRAPGELTSRCAAKLEPLLAVPDLGRAGESPTPVDVIVRLRRAEAGIVPPLQALATYYEKQDYKDDDFRTAPALWTALAQPLAELRAASEEAWTVAQPAVRTEIRRLQADYARTHGEDLAWWRVELGHLHQDLENLDARTPRAPERREVAGKLRAQIERAPIELRRELRSFSETLALVEQGEGQTSSPTTYALWNKVDDEVGQGPIPKEPERPPSCGGDV